MKIIDYEKKGNVVRFYLGKDDLKEWYGDDWNDIPYEHNAGRVYDEFISAYYDIAFPFEDTVLEPCDGVYNSEYCKEAMISRDVPCIIVVPKKITDDCWFHDFARYAPSANVKKYYFGDRIDSPDIKEYHPEYE